MFGIVRWLISSGRKPDNEGTVKYTLDSAKDKTQKYKCSKCKDTGVYDANEGHEGIGENWRKCSCQK
jgi:hypothetical protein